MIAGHARDVEGKLYNSNGAKNALKKSLIGPKEGWKDYVMRLFEVEAGGYSPNHSHPWPHIAYVTKGKGIVNMAGTDHEVEEGSFAYVPPGVKHQFVNTGSDKFCWICIVPPEGDA
ncbi:MAG: cupin domain-containing protein [Peptococcaceae bacterium]|jgi:quercetin dioxygenase-like cupin family protein|nr:cupin domain-containing protein [Peptococcaceae bacterium]MDH7524604.1 cupin domain-containing protein [Peptococcaceae bacterium]